MESFVETQILLQEGIDKFWLFLNSEFSKAAIGSAFGAFGAAYALWKIEKRKRQEDNLSLINSAIVQTLNNIMDIQTLKTDRIDPALREIEKSQESLKAHLVTNKETHISLANALVHILETEYPNTLAIEALLKNKFDMKAYITATKAKQSFEQISAILRARNDLLKEIESRVLPTKDKYILALGFDHPDGSTDNRLSSIHRSLLLSVNYGIYFGRLSIKNLIEVGKRELPKNLHKKLIDDKILDQLNIEIAVEELQHDWEAININNN